ncbi:hypothetical protein D3C86_2096800 [compost metagenome]
MDPNARTSACRTGASTATLLWDLVAVSDSNERHPLSITGTTATKPSWRVITVVRSVPIRRFGSGTATWPYRGSGS